MPHDRFFVDTPFEEHAEIDLQHEARHLKVMRVREGETLELVNGRNQLAQAALSGLKGKILTVEERPAPKPLILCQAIPRLNRLDTIVEKGTELGMTELWLFPGKLSEKKELSANQLKRLEQITIAALKQCGRLDLPKIKLKEPLLKWDSIPCAAYFGTLSKAPAFTSILDKSKEICFFIGPEAGLTADEEAHLMQLGAQGVNLHPNILRTDTASLVALALCQ